MWNFLTAKNMAVRLIKGKECTNTITELLTDDTILEDMRASIKRYSKGNSSENIYRLLKTLCDKIKYSVKMKKRSRTKLA